MHIFKEGMIPWQQQNTRKITGEYEARIWDGTFNPDDSKHRKRLVSKKSSADLERQVNRLKNGVENGKYVQKTDIFLQIMQMNGCV